jgi:hypothetical protein
MSEVRGRRTGRERSKAEEERRGRGDKGKGGS